MFLNLLNDQHFNMKIFQYCSDDAQFISSVDLIIGGFWFATFPDDVEQSETRGMQNTKQTVLIVGRLAGRCRCCWEILMMGVWSGMAIIPV